jgi:hypothetical protein
MQNLKNKLKRKLVSDDSSAIVVEVKNHVEGGIPDDARTISVETKTRIENKGAAHRPPLGDEHEKSNSRVPDHITNTNVVSFADYEHLESREREDSVHVPPGAIPIVKSESLWQKIPTSTLLLFPFQSCSNSILRSNSSILFPTHPQPISNGRVPLSSSPIFFTSSDSGSDSDWTGEEESGPDSFKEENDQFESVKATTLNQGTKRKIIPDDDESPTGVKPPAKGKPPAKKMNDQFQPGMSLPSSSADLVQCPACGSCLPSAYINPHLDHCLT